MALIFIIGIVMIITMSRGYIGTKHDRTHLTTNIFLTLGCLAIIAFGVMIYNTNHQRRSDEYVSAADGFTIDEYKILLNVKENGAVDVMEYIVVEFFEENHHGIYRFIPSWLEYTDKNNNIKSRKAEIDNLMAVGEDYTIDTVKGKERVKIGNPYITLPIGKHAYTITYTYDMGADPYEGFDEFIFHAFGDYWGTRINNASLTVNLPKHIAIDGNLHFFADKYRENDITNQIEYHLEGNTLSASVKNEYKLLKSLTIDLELPEGYFTNGKDNYGNISLTMCMICIAMTFITIILWRFLGKDRKEPATVEFYPPDNLDASEIGYIYKKSVGKKLTIALIVELASKGFIRFEDTGEKSDPRIINNTVNNNTNNNIMTVNEEIVFKNLFGSSDTETRLSLNTNFYNTFASINKSVKEKFDDTINDLRAHRAMVASSIMFVIGAVLLGFAYCFIKDLNPKYDILYLLTLISIVLMLFLTIIMQRMQTYGEVITARIKGFKEFIELAEKDQIEAQVEKHPNYFYDILPYAYVLGVSKKWIERFENIPIPESSIGEFDYNDIDSLLDSIGYPITYTSGGSSKSDGCSSCGGGCSSCGGGCSSCGGGGSW